MLVSSLIAPRPSTRKRPSVPTDSSAVPSTVDHPLSYWRSLPKESLRLECNTLHLVDTGTIPTLARRIYDYHRHQLPAASHRNRTTDQSALPYVPEPHLIHDSSVTFSAPPVSPVGHPAAEPPHFSSPPFNPVVTAAPVPDINEIADLVVQRLLSSPTFTTAMPQQRNITSVTDHFPLPIQQGAAAANGGMPNLLTPIQPLSSRPTQQSPSAMLPAIPPAVREQIRNGEFINFKSLLPSSSPITNDDYTIKIAQGSGHDTSLSLVPRHQVRPKILSFNDWLTAWNNFIRCASYYHPHLANQYLYYQTMICQFASQYEFASWSTYDQLFRARLVNNPSMSWDQIDEELYNRFIRGGTLQSICFHCRNFGHYAANCPQRPSERSVPLASSTGSQSTPGQNQPFRAPQLSSSTTSGTTQVCHFFNNRGQCLNRDNCPFAHQCSTCYGDHPHTHCSKRRFSRR